MKNNARHYGQYFTTATTATISIWIALIILRAIEYISLSWFTILIFPIIIYIYMLIVILLMAIVILILTTVISNITQRKIEETIDSEFENENR